MFFEKFKQANDYRKIQDIVTHRKHVVKKCKQYKQDLSTIPGYTVILLTNAENKAWLPVLYMRILIKP